MAESLARTSRLDEARLMLEKTPTYSNHMGLYTEEIGSTGAALGNFPRAFTDLALITACSNTDKALNKAGHQPTTSFM
jgi:GH15 family glucan-1,4-alpha-glucosidase